MFFFCVLSPSHRSFFFHVSLFLSNSSSSSMNRSSSGEYEEKKKWKKEMEKYFSYNVFCSTLLHTHISLCSGLSQKAPRVYEKPKQTRVEVRSREEEEVRWLNVELSTSLFSLLLPILLLHFDFFSLLVSQPFHSTHSATCQCAQIETLGSEICVALLLRAHSPICLFKCVINEKNKHRLWKC